jgi:hypothetical protein
MRKQYLLCVAPAVALAFASACQDKSSGAPSASATPVASAASAATSSSAAPLASASSAAPALPPPCTVESTTTLDKGARADTGLTVVMLAGNQAAIGYAVGDTPKVITIDTAGKAEQTDVSWAHVHDQEKKSDPAMTRYIHRVTPLGFKGKTMRVGMDILDESKDKNAARYLRCGAGDDEPIIADTTPLNFYEPTEDAVAALGPDVIDVRDCRTFSNGESTWSLYTEVRRDGTADDHDIRLTWSLDTLPGKGTIKNPNVDKRVVKASKDKKYGTLDHFSMPVSVNAGTAGFMMVARDSGGLVFARRNDDLSAAGGPWPMAFSEGAGLPSIMHKDERVFLAATQWNKTDLFTSTFLGTEAPKKPAKVTVADTSPPSDGARDWPSLSPSSDGSLFVSFLDGKSPKRRVRLVVLGEDMSQKTSDVFDVYSGDSNIVEARAIAIAGKKALVTYLDAKGDLIGSVVSCTY